MALAKDPFEDFIRPPLNETPSEKATRRIREAEEKRISDAIDEQIRQDRQILQKRKELVKILLLGQSESGKSTTLKNFRLAYAREEWEAEKASWRAVIQLNLVRCITSILQALQAEIEGDPLLELDETDTISDARGSIDILSVSNDGDSISTQSQFSPEELQYLQTFRLRLAPLRRVEMVLKMRLGAGTEEITSMEEIPESRSDSGSELYQPEAPDARYVARVRRSRRRRIQGEEMVVRGLRWREFLSRKRSLSGRARVSMDTQDGFEDVAGILASCKEDMKVLWMNPTMRGILRKRKIEMENNAGFFLNDIDRIAINTYIPSDDDVVRSRLRTLGVQEYRITIDSPPIFKLNVSRYQTWLLYDVGGSRTMRRAWIPYFEDVNAIIFLAPVSTFDENLLEDPSINRLNDSVALWKAVISSRLLQKTTMICFLNKCDILKRKLKSGIRFSNYVRDYANQANDLTPVVKFIKERFRTIAAKYSIEKRTTYIYTTSVTDTKATAATLKSVRDGILRENLTTAQLV